MWAAVLTILGSLAPLLLTQAVRCRESEQPSTEGAASMAAADGTEGAASVLQQGTDAPHSQFHGLPQAQEVQLPEYDAVVSAGRSNPQLLQTAQIAAWLACLLRLHNMFQAP